MDAAASSLQRLRSSFFGWGTVTGQLDKGYVERFSRHVNEDLNMPRALAVTWSLVKSDLPGPVKRATLLDFDHVLGLGLDGWKPMPVEIPANIVELARHREEARKARKWQVADDLREEILAAGYEVQDMPDGPQIRPLA
jgi:cysteinyl-tRNA synthetase